MFAPMRSASRIILFTNAMLWLLVVGSAMAVVRATHESRVLYNVLEKNRRESAELHVQWGQYLLERSALASYGRVEKTARDELSMVVPKGEQLVIIHP